MTDDTLEAFEGYYHALCVRKYGARPAPATVATKISRLRSAAHRAQVPVAVLVRTTFTSRREWEKLLARLFADLAPGTVGNVVSACRDLAGWAVDAGIIAEHVIQPRDAPIGGTVKPHKLYTVEEIERLITAARAVRGAGRRFSALVLVTSETACRIGEALSLEFAAINAEHDPPHAVLGQTKSGKPQYLALSARAAVELGPTNRNALLAETGRYERDGDRYPFPWHYASVRTMLARVCARVDVPPLGWHALRHSRATALLVAGAPINAVSSLLRHSSIAVTGKYYDHSSPLSYAHYLDP